MAKKTKECCAQFGKFAFFAGLIVAVLVGIFSATPTPGFAAAIVLLILGLIIGIVNITEKEIVPFLIASIALMVLGTANVIPFEWINRIIAAIIVLVVPAALIGALKAIYVMGSKK